MGWSKDIGHDICEYDDELVNDLKQNAVPAELFNQVIFDFLLFLQTDFAEI